MLIHTKPLTDRVIFENSSSSTVAHCCYERYYYSPWPVASIFNTSRTIQRISASVNPTDAESGDEGVFWLLRVVDWDVSLRVVAGAGCRRFLFVGG